MEEKSDAIHDRAPISQVTAALQRAVAARTPSMHDAINEEDSVAEAILGDVIDDEIDIVLMELGWTRAAFVVELSKFSLSIEV